MKKAIVVVSFGTSIKRAYETGIKPIEDAVKNTFKDFDVLNAYTSNIIRKKLKERDGIEILTIFDTLEKLNEADYKEIIVQPTHIIPGHEYEKVLSSVQKFRNLHSDVNITLGKPLLYDSEDFKDIQEAFEDDISNLNEDTGLVLMGHGTDHFANSAYYRVIYNLKQKHKNIYMTLVEDELEFHEIAKEIKMNHIKSVKIKPFMIVAGDHALNDMASDEDDSLKSFITGEGVACNCEVVGLGSYGKVIQMFIKKIEGLIENSE